MKATIGGLFAISGILMFDWLVWSHLIDSGWNFGAIIGYGLLALLSIPGTLIGGFFALALIAIDME